MVRLDMSNGSAWPAQQLCVLPGTSIAKLYAQLVSGIELGAVDASRPVMHFAVASFVTDV